MGADVAGLFAFYATLNHIDKFGKCVLFSPAFWYNQAELRDYVNSLHITFTDNRFGFVQTSADTDWTTDEIAYYGSWLYDKGFLVSHWEIDGAHDDRTWGKAFKNVLSEEPEYISNTNKQSVQQASNNADITWYFMKGEGTTSLTCDGTPTQKG